MTTLLVRPLAPDDYAVLGANARSVCAAGADDELMGA